MLSVPIKKNKIEHDVQCNMKMVTIPMLLVMNTFNVNRKTVVFLCMHCMINYVQEEANCIAVPVRKENNFFLSKAFKALSFLMHFETALEETQS